MTWTAWLDPTSYTDVDANWEYEDRITTRNTSGTYPYGWATGEQARLVTYSYDAESVVPAGNDINGIEVRINATDANSTTNVYDLTVEISNDGGSTWSSPANIIIDDGKVANSWTDYTEGGITDLWGLTWDRDAGDVSNTNLRVRTNCVYSTDDDQAYPILDVVEVRIDYSASGSQSEDLTGQESVTALGTVTAQVPSVPAVAGDIQISRDAAAQANYDSTTYTNFPYATEVVNGSVYSYSAGQFTFGDGHHLVIYNCALTTTSGTARSERNARLYVNNTEQNLYGACSGYIRRTGSVDDCFILGATILETSNSADVEVRVARTDTTTALVGTRTNESGFQVISLDDDWNYARIRGAATQALTDVAQGWTTLTLQTNDELDSGAFARSGNDITLNTTNPCLVCYSVEWTGSADREGGLARLMLNSVEVVGSRTFGYGRATDGVDNPVGSGMCIIEPASSGLVLNVQSAVSTGETGGETLDSAGVAIAIVELPAGANWAGLRLNADTAYSTTEAALDWDGTATNVDTGDFTHSTVTNPSRLIVDNAGDYLLWCDYQTTRTTGSTRENNRARIGRNGTAISNYGSGGDINRGDQGVDDVFDSAGLTAIIYTGAAANDYFETLFQELASDQDGTVQSEYSSMFGLRLDTLFSTGDESTTLTGVSSTSAVGTLTTQTGNSEALTGVSSTSAVGTLAPQTGVSVTLTGIAATGEVGTVTPGIGTGVTLTGQESPGQTGTVTPQTGVSTTLTGAEGTGELGTLQASLPITTTLTGVEGTGALGTTTPQTGVSVTLAGQESVTELGTITASVPAIVTLDGQESVTAVGTLTPQAGVSTTLTGQESTGEVGTVTPGQGVGSTLTGQSSASAVGTLSPQAGNAVTLTGQESTEALGTIQASITVSTTLTGVESASAVGTLSPQTGASVELTGQESTSEVGTVQPTISASFQLAGVESSSDLGTTTPQTGVSVVLPWRLGIVIAWPLTGIYAPSTGSSTVLTGQESTGEVGTLTAQVPGGATANLTGQESTSEVGTLSVQAGSSVTLAGQESVSAVGTVTPQTGSSVALSGQEGASELGTLTAQTPVSVTLTGQESASAVGALQPQTGLQVTLAGVESATAVGTVTAQLSASVTLTGQAATGQVGTITVDVAGNATTTLTGQVSTAAVGTLTPQTSVSVSLVGQSSVTELGTVAAQLPATVTLIGLESTTGLGVLTPQTAVSITLGGVESATELGTVSTPITRRAICELTLFAATSFDIRFKPAVQAHLETNPALLATTNDVVPQVSIN